MGGLVGGQFVGSVSVLVSMRTGMGEWEELWVGWMLNAYVDEKGMDW
jgi:hypothetical protein